MPEPVVLRMESDEARAVHHALKTTISLMDQVGAIPPEAPLYGWRDRLADLARRLDHEINDAERAARLAPWVRGEVDRSPLPEFNPPEPSDRSREPDGFLFVCRNARGQHRHGGNVAVCWDKDEELRLVDVDHKEGRDDDQPGA